VGPSNDQYACSTINTQPGGTQVTSTCGIPYSAMKSGTWKIIMSGQQVQVQRIVTLTVGVPQTTTVTATPTIVLGITSTPRASTVLSTIQQTATLVLVPGTVTAACSGSPVTVTQIPRGPTITITSTILRTATDGAKTSYYTTTLSTQAVCHYPTSGSPPTPVFCIGQSCSQSSAEDDVDGRDTHAPPVHNRDGPSETDAFEPTEKRSLEERAYDAVAAVTTTVTETTYTVTQTVVTTVPATTTTEIVMQTITATVAPAPTTVCSGGGRPGQTVTVNPPASTVTQTNIIYQTTHLSGTVWVGQTAFTTFSNAASATACWRAGGWYGN
jgi:hypothetical protein